MLFKSDLETQGDRLLAMIKAAVDGLQHLDRLLPAVHALGHRHAGYGVREAHRATVGAALLWTLERGLGNTFSADLRDAWTTVYGALAAAMQQDARTDPTAPPLAAAACTIRTIAPVWEVRTTRALPKVPSRGRAGRATFFASGERNHGTATAFGSPAPCDAAADVGLPVRPAASADGAARAPVAPPLRPA